MPLEIQDISGDIQSIARTIQEHQVSSVSVKLPDFWTHAPEIWFYRAESQFHTKGIKQDETKFHYVVSTLDATTALRVQPVLQAPPETDKYEALKKSLLAAFAKTQAQKDAELLALGGLGDMKPTALLTQLRTLNSDTATQKSTLFRAHFLALLPSDIKTVLASHKIDDLDELAETADRIMEASRTASGHIAPVEIAATATRSQAGSGRPAVGQGGDSGGKHVCHYHIRFGNRARNCKPWCLLYSQHRSSAGTSQQTGNPGQGNAQAGRT